MPRRNLRSGPSLEVLMHSLLRNKIEPDLRLSQTSLIKGEHLHLRLPLSPLRAGKIEEEFRGDIDRVGISMSFSWLSRFRSQSKAHMVKAK